MTHVKWGGRRHCCTWTVYTQFDFIGNKLCNIEFTTCFYKVWNRWIPNFHPQNFLIVLICLNLFSFENQNSQKKKRMWWEIICILFSVLTKEFSPFALSWLLNTYESAQIKLFSRLRDVSIWYHWTKFIKSQLKANGEHSLRGMTLLSFKQCEESLLMRSSQSSR